MTKRKHKFKVGQLVRHVGGRNLGISIIVNHLGVGSYGPIYTILCQVNSRELQENQCTTSDEEYLVKIYEKIR